MNNDNFSGPNALGVPRTAIPNWLDHTANSQQDQSVHGVSGAVQDPGPNAYGARTNTGTKIVPPAGGNNVP